jgi:hypothetical protein
MKGEGGKEGESKFRLELAAAILLGFSAFATSWIGYQSSRWDSEETQSIAKSNALRVESNRAAGQALIEQAVDVGLFTNWANAYATGNTALDSFYRDRFRGEFKPAFEAWIASKPLGKPGSAPTPFVMPEYKLAKRFASERLGDSAEAMMRDSRMQAKVKDRYFLNVLVFAMALFITGIYREFSKGGIQFALIILSAGLCLIGLIFVLSLPILI